MCRRSSARVCRERDRLASAACEQGCSWTRCRRPHVLPYRAAAVAHLNGVCCAVAVGGESQHKPPAYGRPALRRGRTRSTEGLGEHGQS
eukprot:12393881-Alexandrium_andersonii.AAC.1